MIELNPNDGYGQQFKLWLDNIHPELLTNPSIIETLPTEQQATVIADLLSLACQAQNSRNITLGRAGLVALPRSWLIERIEVEAAPILAEGDEWEYRRLLELYELLDYNLTQRLIAQGLHSKDPEINEAAQDALARLS